MSNTEAVAAGLDASQLKKDWSHIAIVLAQMGLIGPDITYDQLLADRLHLTHNQYMSAIRFNLRRPTLFLRRKVKDIWMNSFSPRLAKLMGANVDVQGVTNDQSAANYLTNYNTKFDRSLSITMKAAIEKATNDG